MIQEIWKMSILHPKTSKEFYHHIKFAKSLMKRRKAYQKYGTQNSERTQGPMWIPNLRRTQDPISTHAPKSAQNPTRTQDPMKTQNPMRNQDAVGLRILWRPGTLLGPRNLQGPRTLWRHWTLWGTRTLWGPTNQDPISTWDPRTLGGPRTLWRLIIFQLPWKDTRKYNLRKVSRFLISFH